MSVISITSKCYNEILKYALVHANPQKSRTQWKEVVGFLIGRITASDIFITDVVMSTEGSLVYVVENDYSKLPWDRIEQGEYLVGWVHSHPGHGLFLSGIDVQCQLNYQRLHEKAVALVIDPTIVTSSFSGIKAFRVNSHSEYYPVSLQISDVTDFSEVYDSILIPLEAELENILVQFRVPSEIAPESPFQIFIEYQHFPAEIEVPPTNNYRSPLVSLKYRLVAKNATLLTRVWGGSFRHELNKFGTVAIIRFLSGKTGIGNIKLQDIQLGLRNNLLALQNQEQEFIIRDV